MPPAPWDSPPYTNLYRYVSPTYKTLFLARGEEVPPGGRECLAAGMWGWGRDAPRHTFDIRSGMLYVVYATNGTNDAQGIRDARRHAPHGQSRRRVPHIYNN